MINQPEIGILGFALRRGRADGLEILCNAKPEPGNVHVIQVAPSFQATRSNFERRHGGARQVLHDWFLEPGRGRVISSSLQTETSEFFFRKRNLNVVRLLAEDDYAADAFLPPSLRWFPLEAVLSQIDVPFLFNTDARSVLVSVDWRQVAAEGRPFHARRLEFGLQVLLEESAAAMDSPSQLRWREVEEWMAQLKVRARPPATEVSLRCTVDWKVGTDRIAHRVRERYTIHQISVEMPGREREKWDQPILTGSLEGLVALVCCAIGGTMHFHLHVHSACGSFHGFDVNALQVDPYQYPPVRDGQILDRIGDLVNSGRATVLAASQFSDEGGRFFHTVSRYEVILLHPDDLSAIPEDFGVWLTLGQLKALIDIGELVSNEARSALSLLLRYL